MILEAKGKTRKCGCSVVQFNDAVGGEVVEGIHRGGTVISEEWDVIYCSTHQMITKLAEEKVEQEMVMGKALGMYAEQTENLEAALERAVEFCDDIISTYAGKVWDRGMSDEAHLVRGMARKALAGQEAT